MIISLQPLIRVINVGERLALRGPRTANQNRTQDKSLLWSFLQLAMWKLPREYKTAGEGVVILGDRTTVHGMGENQADMFKSEQPSWRRRDTELDLGLEILS